MNTKTHFRISGIILNSLLLIFLLPGCSTFPESLSAKESRMSEDLLRSQVLRYKAEVEKQRIEIATLLIQCGQPEDTPFTSDMLKQLMKDHPQLSEKMTGLTEGLSNYEFFHKKLKEKGGDMTGLELFEGKPFILPELFSPPIEDPEVPSPDAKTVAEV